jgi:exodeoxyribonuclease VII large subunit
MNETETRRPLSKIQTVDELSDTIKNLISGSPSLRSVGVRGEIQGFKRHSSGHVYFTLAGKESKIAAVLFRSYAQGVVAWPEDGDEVLVTGSVDVYPRGGTYQLYATRILPVGEGARRRAKEELKAALEREGLFDIRHKRPIPNFPLKVAVITSVTGAAVRDILEVSSKRAPFADIVLIPATVQGADAPPQVSRALALAGTLPGVSCVIVARGGGAKDELSPFDDERIVRAVRSCPLPVVTGVGHQIDSSLADLAADAALPTPSAAAERVFPNAAEIMASLSSCRDILRSLVSRRLDFYESEFGKRREKFFNVMNEKISEAEITLGENERALIANINGAIESRERDLAGAASALEAFSPLSVLARGYSICTDASGRAVKSSSALKTGDRVTLRFNEGAAEADISGILN